MRLRLALGAALLGLSAGPALAQVQQSNPNAANESFALQSQFRSLNQQQTSQYNVLTMQQQRNVQFSPPRPLCRRLPGGAARAVQGPARAQHQHLHRVLMHGQSGVGRDKSRKPLSSSARSVQNRVR